MRYQLQEGIIEERGRGQHKYYCGRYSLYVKDETGKEVRKRPRPFLGYCNQISRSEAKERLQQLIRNDQAENKITEDQSDAVRLNELEQLEDLLEDAAAQSNIDWHITAEVAHECCWSVEVRITAVPNAAGPDHSDVFLSCGHDSPEECALDLLPTIKRYLSRSLPAGNDS